MEKNRRMFFMIVLAIFIISAGVVVNARSYRAAPRTHSAAYQAFYNILQTEIAEYGISVHDSESARMTAGVFSAWLIDFNNDGVPELLYNRVEDDSWIVRYFVYGYSEDSAALWFDGEATPYSTGPAIFAIARSESGEQFLLQSTMHMWSDSSLYYSFAKGAGIPALSSSALRGMEEEGRTHYYVNDERVSEEVYNNAPEVILSILSTSPLEDSPVEKILARVSGGI